MLVTIWVLPPSDQVEVIDGAMVHLRFLVGQLSGAAGGILVHQQWRLYFLKAGFDGFVVEEKLYERARCSRAPLPR